MLRHPSICFALFAAMCLPAYAQQPAADYSALNGSMASENYVEAKKQADQFLRNATPAQRAQLSLCYGRILLGLGEKEAARQYLKTMKAAKLDLDGTHLMAVYEAWLGALDGKPEPGIKALEAALERNTANMATPEAADVLAMLYMSAGEKDKAKKAVDFGLNFVKYHTDLKHPYIEPLLRGRLASNIASPEAKKLYDAAEKLRTEGKFAEAGQGFQQVRGSYPKSEWAPAAAFRMGQCFVGLGRDKQALDHWKTFIKEQPGGPWRGQAHVAAIDLVLEKQLDLTKATEHALEATAVLGKPQEKESEASWKDAALDIHMRQGIIALVDHRYDAAALAFNVAQSPSTVPGQPRAAVPRLAPLLAAASTKSAVVPEDLASGERQTTTALAFGTIYNALGDYDRAKVFFTWALNSKGRSEAHRSFAMLGMARVMAGKCEGEQPFSLAWDRAKAGYQSSLKEYAKGAWHDQTLRELALLTERIATERNPLPAPSDNAKAPAAKGKSTSAANPGAPGAVPAGKGKASSSPAVILLAARGEALPFWTDLAKRFPNSPHAAEALYHAGVLLSEKAQATPEGKSEQIEKDAASAFKRLCEDFPKSPYVADAYVHQIDFALEYRFDQKRASTLVEQGTEWAKQRSVKLQTNADGTFTKETLADATKAIQDGMAETPFWGQVDTRSAANMLDGLYNFYLRAGIVA